MIQTKDGVITLSRTSPGNNWIAPDKFSYPAASDKIGRLVRQLNDMRLIEAKTANAERYARLEVEDLADDAQSRLIRLEDRDGNILAETLIGKRLLRLTGSANSGTYIRRPGEDQSWLASGGFELDPAIETWLDQLIVEINRKEIAKVAITLDNGETYGVSRKEAGDALDFFELLENETLKPDANLAELATALTSVRMASVKPDAEMTWPEKKHVARVQTFGGLNLTIELALIEDQPWATFLTTLGDVQGDAVAVDQARQRVEVIADKTAGWAYQINQSLYQRLTKPRSSWVEEPDSTS